MCIHNIAAEKKSQLQEYNGAEINTKRTKQQSLFNAWNKRPKEGTECGKFCLLVEVLVKLITAANLLAIQLKIICTLSKLL